MVSLLIVELNRFVESETVVTKILLTHKHNDHSGELRSFPNAKIYVNADEIGVDELEVPSLQAAEG